ncbi:MAG: type II toxin-antitoxin system Phd/YefM family antitoxin [Candidatus Hodarchaeales archaeon]
MSESSPKFIVDKNGKKVSVILTIEEYNELLEDIHDLKVVMERREEKTIKRDGDI